MNKVLEIRQRMVPNGVEIQGITRSDRGTKYIAKSVVVLNEPGQKYPSREAIEKAINEVYSGSE